MDIVWPAMGIKTLALKTRHCKRIDQALNRRRGGPACSAVAQRAARADPARQPYRAPILLPTVRAWRLQAVAIRRPIRAGDCRSTRPAAGGDAGPLPSQPPPERRLHTAAPSSIDDSGTNHRSGKRSKHGQAAGTCNHARALRDRRNERIPQATDRAQRQAIAVTCRPSVQAAWRMSTLRGLSSCERRVQAPRPGDSFRRLVRATRSRSPFKPTRAGQARPSDSPNSTRQFSA